MGVCVCVCLRVGWVCGGGVEGGEKEGGGGGGGLRRPFTTTTTTTFYTPVHPNSAAAPNTGHTDITPTKVLKCNNWIAARVFINTVTLHKELVIICYS